MDPIWKNLPLELSEHVCNQLPKVRRIPVDLAAEIKNQDMMYARVCTKIVLMSIEQGFPFDTPLFRYSNWLLATPEERSALNALF